MAQAEGILGLYQEIGISVVLIAIIFAMFKLVQWLIQRAQEQAEAHADRYAEVSERLMEALAENQAISQAETAAIQRMSDELVAALDKSTTEHSAALRDLVAALQVADRLEMIETMLRGVTASASGRPASAAPPD